MIARSGAGGPTSPRCHALALLLSSLAGCSPAPDRWGIFPMTARRSPRTWRPRACGCARRGYRSCGRCPAAARRGTPPSRAVLASLIERTLPRSTTTRRATARRFPARGTARTPRPPRRSRQPSRPSFHAGRPPRRARSTATRALRQPIACFTSAVILASSAAVHAVSANAVGHIAPSSRCALSLKPSVAYRVLNFWPL